MNPVSPIFIISKGRWESRLTSKALEAMKVPYYIAVEPQEYDKYAAVIDPKKILVAPFSNLGQGSIPVRNFVWDKAIEMGAKWHFCMDDNISGFVRLNRNLKVQFSSGTPFWIAERFVERYDNVGIAGFHYDFFAKRKQKLPPFYLNRRIYSCLLIRNDLPYRWRGRYNEDTDLSLRALKGGWSTILFLALLCCKAATMTMKGGNTDELYGKSAEKEQDGRYLMAQSLCEQHPDVSAIHWKFGRWQHHVDYSPFKNNDPRMKPGLDFGESPNEYGLTLRIGEER